MRGRNLATVASVKTRSEKARIGREKNILLILFCFGVGINKCKYKIQKLAQAQFTKSSH